VLAAVYPPGWLVGGQGAREGVLEGLREGRRVGEDLVGQRRPSSWIREEMLDRGCSLLKKTRGRIKPRQYGIEVGVETIRCNASLDATRHGKCGERVKRQQVLRNPMCAIPVYCDR